MRRRRVPIFGLLLVLLFLAHGAIAVADQPRPLTLSVSSSRETCTLGSVTTLDYSIDGGVPPYGLAVDGWVVDDASTSNYISCRPSEIWSPLEAHGSESVQRISVRVSDSAGARAYAIAELRLIPPLPAPRYLKVNSGVEGDSTVHLSAEWTVPYLPREGRTGEVAIRWRTPGSDEWTVEHHRGEWTYPLSYRASWTVDSRPGGEQREVQVAEIRHTLDLHTPEALLWSPTQLVTTAVPPYELQAEVTHDMITLSWGPHAPGLTYVARLSAVEGNWHADTQERRLDAVSLLEARFEDLIPDTLYRVEVRLIQEDPNRYPIDQHRFEIRSEPAPIGWSPPTRLATDIRAAYTDPVIEVTWTPPEAGFRYKSRVCVKESDIDYWPHDCIQVAPGESRASLLPRGDLWRGGSYQVQVSTLTAPAGTATTETQIPTYGPGLPTRGDPPTAPRFIDVYWRNISDTALSRSLSGHSSGKPTSRIVAEPLLARGRSRILRETKRTKVDEPQVGKHLFGTEDDARSSLWHPAAHVRNLDALV